MDVPIEVKELEKLPVCTCGKCITRRKRKDNFNSLPYNNIQSSYQADYPWKIKPKDFQFFNRAKHTGFENECKETLPNAKESLMRYSYRPHKLNLDLEEKPPERLFTEPFIGDTTYHYMYPNWGSIRGETKEIVKLPEIKVPMRGKSTYCETNKRYDDIFYKNRDPLIIGKDTLRFHGIIPSKSVNHDSYRPHDLNQPEYFGTEPNLRTKSLAFINPDIPSYYLNSRYRIDYIKYDDSTCKLRKLLNNKGIRYLII